MNGKKEHINRLKRLTNGNACIYATGYGFTWGEMMTNHHREPIMPDVKVCAYDTNSPVEDVYFQTRTVLMLHISMGLLKCNITEIGRYLFISGLEYTKLSLYDVDILVRNIRDVEKIERLLRRYFIYDDVDVCIDEVVYDRKYLMGLFGDNVIPDE